MPSVIFSYPCPNVAHTLRQYPSVKYMYMFIYSQELKLVFGQVLHKALTAMNFQILGVCAGLYTQFLHYVLWDTSGSHFHLVLVDEEIAPG